MKFNTLTAAVMAASLMLGQCALAQGRGNDRGDRSDRYDRSRSDEQHRNDRRWDQGRYQNHNQSRNWNNGRRDERGAGPDHAFYRGARLPGQYRSRQYVVDDWRSHRLSAPPRGYHWVQTGADYVLVAIATGVILQLILSQ